MCGDNDLLVRGSQSYRVKCVELTRACDTKVRGKTEICRKMRGHSRQRCVTLRDRSESSRTYHVATSLFYSKKNKKNTKPSDPRF